MQNAVETSVLIRPFGSDGSNALPNEYEHVA